MLLLFNDLIAVPFDDSNIALFWGRLPSDGQATHPSEGFLAGLSPHHPRKWHRIRLLIPPNIILPGVSSPYRHSAQITSITQV
jgi:hypothetical protein